MTGGGEAVCYGPLHVCVCSQIMCSDYFSHHPFLRSPSTCSRLLHLGLIPLCIFYRDSVKLSIRHHDPLWSITTLSRNSETVFVRIILLETSSLSRSVIHNFTYKVSEFNHHLHFYISYFYIQLITLYNFYAYFFVNLTNFFLINSQPIKKCLIFYSRHA